MRRQEDRTRADLGRTPAAHSTPDLTEESSSDEEEDLIDDEQPSWFERHLTRLAREVLAEEGHDYVPDTDASEEEVSEELKHFSLDDGASEIASIDAELSADQTIGLDPAPAPSPPSCH